MILETKIMKLVLGVILALMIALVGITLYSVHQKHQITEMSLTAERNKATNEAYRNAYTKEWQRIYIQETRELNDKLKQNETELADIKLMRSNGTLVLRDKFKCYMQTAGSSEIRTKSGEPIPVLTSEDEEFLIHIAADADRWRTERNYVIDLYNKLVDSINGKTPDQ